MSATKNNPSAKMAKDAKGAKNPNKSLAPLERRIDALEEAIEEVGKTSELRKDIQDYVDDLKAELKDIKQFRWWITVIAVGFSLSLFGIFLYFSIFPPCRFSELEGNIKIPFLISLSVMSVLLMSLCLRGVYQTRKERNYGDFIPENLKVLLKGSGVDTP